MSKKRTTPSILIPPQHPKRHWLWVGVASLTTVVFVMWYLNTRYFISSIHFQKADEAVVANSILSDFEQAITSLSTNDEVSLETEPTNTERVKNILAEEFMVIAALATSTTSTLITATSTLTATTTEILLP